LIEYSIHFFLISSINKKKRFFCERGEFVGDEPDYYQIFG
jgi:hypothetical protein